MRRLELRRRLTGHPMRAHFTICPNRPAAPERVTRRRRNLEVSRGRPRGRRMKAVGAAAPDSLRAGSGRISRYAPSGRELESYE
jgi:hypothetical protein